MPRRSAIRPARTARNEAPAVSPPWLRPAILALSALFLIAFTSTDVADPDTWQHLASGKYIVEHHAFPTPDPFAFTTGLVKPAYLGEEATRLFNITHERLAQILLYLTYAHAGFAGLGLLRCASLAAFCGIIGLIAWHRTNSFYRGLAAAALAATVACEFRADRPYLWMGSICLQQGFSAHCADTPRAGWSSALRIFFWLRDSIAATVPDRTARMSAISSEPKPSLRRRRHSSSRGASRPQTRRASFWW
jgi:hypothetical protein